MPPSTWTVSVEPLELSAPQAELIRKPTDDWPLQNGKARETPVSKSSRLIYGRDGGSKNVWLNSAAGIAVAFGDRTRNISSAQMILFCEDMEV